MKILVVGFFIFAAFVTFALDLDSARQQNLVEELPSGYLKVIDPKAQSLVDDVNAKRKVHFEAIAKKTNVPVDVVGSNTAKKIKKMLQAK